MTGEQPGFKVVIKDIPMGVTADNLYFSFAEWAWEEWRYQISGSIVHIAVIKPRKASCQMAFVTSQTDEWAALAFDFFFGHWTYTDNDGVTRYVRVGHTLHRPKETPARRTILSRMRDFLVGRSQRAIVG